MTILVRRLKERKLVQWGLAYLAGAWVLLQVFAELRDTFAWPPVIVRALTVLLAVGFLAALVIAWYHGITFAAEQGSVAVLPFVNLSGDPAQEYFSDGLTEELLNELAKAIPASSGWCAS